MSSPRRRRFGNPINLWELGNDELETMIDDIFLWTNTNQSLHDKKYSYYIAYLYNEYDPHYDFEYGLKGGFKLGIIGRVNGQPGNFESCRIDGTIASYRLAHVTACALFPIKNCSKEIREQITSACKVYQLTKIIET